MRYLLHKVTVARVIGARIPSVDVRFIDSLASPATVLVATVDASPKSPRQPFPMHLMRMFVPVDPVQ